MSAVEAQGRPAVEKLPPLTDEQVARVAALLNVASRRQPLNEGRGGKP